MQEGPLLVVVIADKENPNSATPYRKGRSEIRALRDSVVVVVIVSV